MLRLLRLRPVLLQQETALGNHHLHTLPQRRLHSRVGGERARGGVAEKDKHGLRDGRREADVLLLAQLFEFGGGQGVVFGAELVGGEGEDVAEAGDLVVAGEGGGGPGRGGVGGPGQGEAREGDRGAWVEGVGGVGAEFGVDVWFCCCGCCVV
jgi:hypothetical protein